MHFQVRRVRILVWPRRCSNCSRCSLLQRPPGHGQWNQSFIQSTALGSCTSSKNINNYFQIQIWCYLFIVYHPYHTMHWRNDIIAVRVLQFTSMTQYDLWSQSFLSAEWEAKCGDFIPFVFTISVARPQHDRNAAVAHESYSHWWLHFKWSWRPWFDSLCGEIFFRMLLLNPVSGFKHFECLSIWCSQD